MADLKISALTGASTPLAGTEVLPIVQSSTTKKVSVADLTAGRVISASGGTFKTTGAYGTVSVDNTGTTGGGLFSAKQNGATSGIVGVSGAIRGDTSSNLGLFSETGKSIEIFVNGDATAVGSFTTAGNYAPASGKGIDFAATAGTGTSELLADYEEGTWSPVLAFGGASVGITYSAGNRGIYTKIGNNVVVNALLELTSKGSSTGTAVLSGLPFTSNQYINYVGVSALYGNITVLGTIQPLLVGNTTNINLYEVTATGGTTQLDNTDFANNSYVFISFSYQV